MMTIHQIVNSIFNSCSYVLTQDKRSWLVDSVSMSGTLSNAHDISERIMLENVP